MLMAGCCFGSNERGAFGFSNEKSFMYWASTLSWGDCCGTGPPFVVVVMNVLRPSGERTAVGTVANTRQAAEQERRYAPLRGAGRCRDSAIQQVAALGIRR